MKRRNWTVWSVLLLAGCASSQPYPYPYSGEVGSSIRYPLDYPICYSPAGGGTLYVPLKLRIAGAGVPDPMVVMARRKKDPSADGCNRSDGSKPVRPLVSMKDTDNTGSLGAFLLDMKGNGFAAVSYRYSLLNANDMRKEAESELRVAKYDEQALARAGEATIAVVEVDEAVVINGLKWRHRVVASYRTTDPGNANHGALLSWNEFYEHAIDNEHVLRQKAHYDAMVIADPEWIAARRAMLRKLVDAIRINPVTQADIDAAVADYDRRRAIDTKCRADKKCRAREGE